MDYIGAILRPYLGKLLGYELGGTTLEPLIAIEGHEGPLSGLGCRVESSTVNPTFTAQLPMIMGYAYPN